MSDSSIVIRGAREHNLRDIDVSIPRDQLVVITGLSGSGKSSLAFDTIYADGQRRYVELCASVFGPDGQTRSGLDRRPFAGCFDRSKDDIQESSIDGGHRNRDL